MKIKNEKLSNEFDSNEDSGLKEPNSQNGLLVGDNYNKQLGFSSSEDSDSSSDQVNVGVVIDQDLGVHQQYEILKSNTPIDAKIKTENFKHSEQVKALTSMVPSENEFIECDERLPSYSTITEKPKSHTKKHNSRMKYDLIAIINIVAQSTYILLSQLFKPVQSYSLWGSVDDVTTPWLIAMICLSSFPILVTVWVYESLRIGEKPFQIQQPKLYRMKIYTLSSVLEAINQVASAFSLVILGLSYYVLIKSSAMVFTFIFFRYMSANHFNYGHYFGVLCVTMSIAILLIPTPFQSSEDRVTSFSQGVICSFISAFVVSFQGMIMHRFYNKQPPVSHYNNAVKNICEFASLSTFGAWILVAPFAIGFEHNTWSLLPPILAKSGNSLAFSFSLIALFLIYPLCKISTLAIINYYHATFIAVLVVPSTVLIVIIGCFASHNHWNVYLSIVFTFGGFLLYIYGIFCEDRRKKRIKNLKKEKNEMQRKIMKELEIAAGGLEIIILEDKTAAMDNYLKDKSKTDQSKEFNFKQKILTMTKKIELMMNKQPLAPA